MCKPDKRMARWDVNFARLSGVLILGCAQAVAQVAGKDDLSDLLTIKPPAEVGSGRKMEFDTKLPPQAFNARPAGQARDAGCASAAQQQRTDLGRGLPGVATLKCQDGIDTPGGGKFQLKGSYGR